MQLTVAFTQQSNTNMCIWFNILSETWNIIIRNKQRWTNFCINKEGWLFKKYVHRYCILLPIGLWSYMTVELEFFRKSQPFWYVLFRNSPTHKQQVISAANLNNESTYELIWNVLWNYIEILPSNAERGSVRTVVLRLPV